MNVLLMLVNYLMKNNFPASKAELGTEVLESIAQFILKNIDHFQ